jgi:hypothetical protein
MAQPTSLYVNTSPPSKLHGKFGKRESRLQEIATLPCGARVAGAERVGWPPRRRVARVDDGRQWGGLPGFQRAAAVFFQGLQRATGAPTGLSAPSLGYSRR